MWHISQYLVILSFFFYFDITVYCYFLWLFSYILLFYYSLLKSFSYRWHLDGFHYFTLQIMTQWITCCTYWFLLLEIYLKNEFLEVELLWLWKILRFLHAPLLFTFLAATYRLAVSPQPRLCVCYQTFEVLSTWRVRSDIIF